MSAYLVGTAHIDTLLSAGLQFGRTYGPMFWADNAEHARTLHTVAGHPNRRELTQLTASRVGQLLQDTNTASVEHLAGKRPCERVVYRYRRDLRFLEPVSVLKAIDCYAYQSCEIPDWIDCEALQFCEALRLWAIPELAGYNAAPAWPIPARTN